MKSGLSGMMITVISENKFRFLRKSTYIFCTQNFVTEISCTQK